MKFKQSSKPKRLAAAFLSVLMIASAAAIPANADTAGSYVGEDSALIKFKKVSLGSDHSAAITETGSLYMWGDNSYGQLGDGTTVDRYSPVKINLKNVVDVELGYTHSAAITADGSLYTWGNNKYGQLGDGTTTNSSKPTKVMQLDNVTDVSLGENYSAAITANGSSSKLYTWGRNHYSQLGDGTVNSSSDPIEINVQNPVSVSISEDHSAVVTADGSLYTWGHNDYCKLGIEGSNRPVPTKVTTTVFDKAASVTVGSTFTLVTDENSDVYYCGSDQLGDVGVRDNYKFRRQKDLSNVNLLSAYKNYCGAVTDSSNLYSFGLTDRTSTDLILNNIISYDIGDNFYAAVDKNGTLYTWGRSQLNGKLGRGDRNDTVDAPAPLFFKYPLVGKAGDIDGNGKLDSADSLFVLRASVGLEALNDDTKALSDVDRTGTVTSADALIVLRYSVGIKDNTYVGTTLYYKS